MNDTPPGPSQASSLDKVTAALAALGEANAAAVAEQAGLGYSTTTPKLRMLEEAGHAERFRNEQGRTLWRLTTAGRSAEASQAAAASSDAGAGTDAALADEMEQQTGGQHGQDAEISAAAQPTHEDSADAAPPSTAGDEIPKQPSTGQSTSRPAAQSDATEGQLQPDPTSLPSDGHEGSGQPGGKVDAEDGPQPTEQTAQPVDSTVEPATDRPAKKPDASQDRAGTSRRAFGTLRGAILDVLEAHPDRQYKTGELCKLIDRANEGTDAAKASRGAVANALYKLVGEQRVIQTDERPATFQLAPDSNQTHR